jgi:tRNA (pseudouridine54-N1)-methyltransferase
MREFVLIGHDAPTSAEFALDALPGEAGRLDLLARSLLAGLLTSHGIRDDARVTLILADEYALRVDGATVRNLHPDERSAAALVRLALADRDAVVGDTEVETAPGIFHSRRGVARTLEDAAAGGTLVQLHEEGTPVVDSAAPSDPVFVLSDHRAFTADEEAVFEELDATRLSLGPRALHADAAIAVANNWLDTDGYETY